MEQLTEKEADRLRLLRELDDHKSQAERNRLGQFATPTALALDIVSTAMRFLNRNAEIKYLEPGFGTGPFYSALRELSSDRQVSKAAGYEVDLHYGEPAKRLWKGTGLRLSLKDFTSTSPPKSEAAKYNLVVCNPPYVRHHHLTREQKQDLQHTVFDTLGIELNGLSGLYTYFMVLSKAWMQEGGVGAWLVPSEFMDVNYGRQIKKFLSESVTLLRVHRFDPSDVQFDDALVSSAVVLFRNDLPPDDHRVQFSFGGTLADPRLSALVALHDLAGVRKWTSLPQSNGKAIHTEEELRLCDLFNIKRGLATGCNEFFVLTPEEASERKIPKQFLIPILPSPRYLKTDVIESDESGQPCIPNRRLLLTCDLDADEVRRSHPSLRTYLEQGIEQGVHERYLCRHREPWYSQEERPSAPFLCTYMGRQTGSNGGAPFRFILNLSAATAANVYLMLYPKPVLSEALGNDPKRLRSLWKALCKITPEMMLGEGRVYGGGLHKMEPKELANVPAHLILDGLPKRMSVAKQRSLFK